MLPTTPSRCQPRYRRYLRDSSAPIPRSTLWRHRKLQESKSPLSSSSQLSGQGVPSQLDTSFSEQSGTTPCQSPLGATGRVTEGSSLPNTSSPNNKTLFEDLSTLSSPDVDLVQNDFIEGDPLLLDSLPDMQDFVDSDMLSLDSLPSDLTLPQCSSPNSLLSQSAPSSPYSSASQSPLHSRSPPSPPSPPLSPSWLSSSSKSPTPHTSTGMPSPPPSSQSQSSDQPSQDSNDKSGIFAPLYKGAEISLCGAMYAIMKFSIDNKLSYTCIGDLLKLLAILCPPDNLLPGSLYTFKKFFQQKKGTHIHKCICLKCKKDTCACQDSSNGVAHLVHMEIHKPLQTVISSNWESLMTPSTSSMLGDVWDGSVLSPLCVPGRFFGDKSHLALSLSTDGVPLFKSSKISMWPVYLVILNLPPNIRMNSENLILCGLWVGPCKPEMDILLNPITQCLRRLSTLGLEIAVPSGLIMIRAKLVLGVFDLPAKAAVLSAKQFNGKFGCSVCLHPGKRLPNNSRVYLPDTLYEERTHSMIIDAASEAQRTKVSIQGVYGTSPLSTSIDLVKSIPVDYMHCVLEGVTRWLLNSWVNSKNHLEPYYIGRKVKNIDRELLKQRPPNEFSHPPRSIQNHLNYWKASELRYWLLFYSLPLLLNRLPPLYWHHYALLVCALHIMLNDSITHAQVDAAEQMLTDFYHLMPELYGESSCTHNCHLLLHLGKYVRLWGPLWTHSAFGFESKNGHLKHLFHGKASIVDQLLFNTDVAYTLQCVHKKLVAHESEETMNYLDRLSHLAPRPNMRNIGSHTYIVGKCEVLAPTLEQSTALGHNQHIETFKKLLKNRTLYYSKAYTGSKDMKRNNTYCCYQDDEDGHSFGVIEIFIASPQPTALIRQLSTMQTTLINMAGHPCRSSLTYYQQADLLDLFITPVDLPTDSSVQLLAVPVTSIVSKAVVITVSGTHYCVVQPNSVERH